MQPTAPAPGEKRGYRRKPSGDRALAWTIDIFISATLRSAQREGGLSTSWDSAALSKAEDSHPGRQQPGARIIALEQMPNLHTVVSSGTRSRVKSDGKKLTHGLGVVNRLFQGAIGQVEPVRHTSTTLSPIFRGRTLNGD